jgi:hypothetical protein
MLSLNDGFKEARMSSYRTSYRSARFVAQMISFFGWVAVICGIIGLVVGVYGVFASYEQYLQHAERGGRELQIFLSLLSTTSIYFSLLGFMSGLLMIAGGQLTRAVVDNADFSGQMLDILRTMNFEKF